MIDTREYVYENRTYTAYQNINFINSSQSYFQCILIFIKNEQFTPFDYGGIKEWHIANVNAKKFDSIIQKCQRLFINYIKGKYHLGERINKIENSLEKTKRQQNIY